MFADRLQNCFLLHTSSIHWLIHTHYSSCTIYSSKESILCITVIHDMDSLQFLFNLLLSSLINLCVFVCVCVLGAKGKGGGRKPAVSRVLSLRRSAGHKFFNLNPQLTVFTTGSREYRFLSICLKTNIFHYIYPPLCPKKPNFPILPTTLMYICVCYIWLYINLDSNNCPF